MVSGHIQHWVTCRANVIFHPLSLIVKTHVRVKLLRADSVGGALGAVSVAGLVDVDGEVGPLSGPHGANLQLHLVVLVHLGLHHNTEIFLWVFLPNPEKDKGVLITEGWRRRGITNLVSRVRLMSTLPPASVLS